MVVTVMKTNFRKLEPKIINYRNYRYFSNDRFREKVTSELSKVVLENSDKGLNKFLDVCKEALNIHAPLKKKYIRGNNSPFINRILSEEIMKRSILRNKFLKSKSEADKKNYVKQSMLRRTKKEYYGNVDPRKVADNRTFWKTVKPFLSNKSVENERIILVEKEEILTKDNSVAKVLNNFFSNIVKTLGISAYMQSHPFAKEVNYPTLRAIMKYRNHPCILTLLDKYKNNSILLLDSTKLKIVWTKITIFFKRRVSIIL